MPVTNVQMNEVAFSASCRVIIDPADGVVPADLSATYEEVYDALGSVAEVIAAAAVRPGGSVKVNLLVDLGNGLSADLVLDAPE